MRTEVGHAGDDDAVARQGIPLQGISSQNRQNVVAIDRRAICSHEQHSIGIAVERNP